LQAGVVNPATAAQDLIAVRFFSASTDYSIGDFVVQAGKGYRAKQAITAGAFNAAHWDTISTNVDLSAYAPLASPALTGNPTAPTQAPGDNDTSIATTQFVTAAIAADVENWTDIVGKPSTFTPSPHGHPQSDITNLIADLGSKAATTYVDSQDALKANLASPAFTGTPTAPTPPVDDNDTSIATTAFVQATVAAGGGGAAATHVDTVPPSPATQGQLWWDSDSGQLYIYYSDVNSSAWVQAVTAPFDLSAYLKMSGGTLTGALSGTTGTFSGELRGSPVTSTGGYFLSGVSSAIVAAAVGAGEVLLRPNGWNATAGQSSLESAGHWTVAGAVFAGFHAGNGIGFNTTGTVSATGYIFPAAQVASANANALDDYEEGTFTPTIVGSTTAGAGTYGSRQGRYTKIGNRVFFEFVVAWTAHTGTGNINIDGLPFTVASQIYPTAYVHCSGLTFTGQLTAQLTVSSTTLALLGLLTNAAAGGIAIDTSVTHVTVVGHYAVA
jgi:hypothetical protein